MGIRGCFTAVAAAAVFASTGGADQVEVMTHYRAYNAALEAGRLDEASVEGEAAWRAAEETWGDDDQTAILAFNLAQLRLALMRTAGAREPAARAAELRRQGYADETIVEQNVLYFAAVSAFEAVNARRDDVDALVEVLGAYESGASAETRPSLLGWMAIAAARSNLRDWEAAYAATERVLALAESDPSISHEVVGVVASVGARASLERAGNFRGRPARQREHLARGIEIAARGVAVYPPQPVGSPIDETLGSLIAWRMVLEHYYSQVGRNERESYTISDPVLNDPAWDDPRVQAVSGCTVEWLEREPPEYPERAIRRGAVFAIRLEFHLDAGGSMGRVDRVAAYDDELGFTDEVIEVMRDWRAAPVSDPRCLGPHQMTFSFGFPE